MHPGLHRALLRGFRALPTPARRRVVRTIAPSFTVGAMCFIERDDGAILLAQQVYRRRWGVPGGLLERREEPASAAVREVAEEVGLDIVLLGEPAVVVDPVPQRVDVVYRAKVAPGCDPDDARAVSPEIARVAWFPAGRLPELQHETAQAFVALARAQGSSSHEAPPRTRGSTGR